MTAFLAVIGSLAIVLGFVTAVIGLLNQRKIKTTAATANATAGKVQEISVNVDGRLSELIERQEQLLGALHAGGLEVPPPTPVILVPENTPVILVPEETGPAAPTSGTPVPPIPEKTLIRHADDKSADPDPEAIS